MIFHYVSVIYIFNLHALIILINSMFYILCVLLCQFSLNWILLVTFLKSCIKELQEVVDLHFFGLVVDKLILRECMACLGAVISSRLFLYLCVIFQYVMFTIDSLVIRELHHYSKLVDCCIFVSNHLTSTEHNIIFFTKRSSSNINQHMTNHLHEKVSLVFYSICLLATQTSGNIF